MSISTHRYEVEIQLGSTGESHIVRTIEYWDIERKRYSAVIVAEDITARFLNVISLFNDHILLIAIQMNALKFGDQISLVFTTVMDQLALGLVEEDEEIQAVTDRNFWETERGTKQTVAMADQLFSLITVLDKNLELKYNKFYIGLATNGQPNNFVVFNVIVRGKTVKRGEAKKADYVLYYKPSMPIAVIEAKDNNYGV